MTALVATDSSLMTSKTVGGMHITAILELRLLWHSVLQHAPAVFSLALPIVQQLSAQGGACVEVSSLRAIEKRIESKGLA